MSGSIGYYCLPRALTSHILILTLISDKGIPPHSTSQGSSLRHPKFPTVAEECTNTVITLAEKGLCQDFRGIAVTLLSRVISYFSTQHFLLIHIYF